MSTAISYTRAAVPRLTSKATRCRRFASTESVSAETTTAPILATQRPKKMAEPLNQKMHRLLYPELYERKDARNWHPTSSVDRLRSRPPPARRMDEKWAPVMRRKGVQTSLSTYMQTPIQLHQSRLLYTIRSHQLSMDSNG
jgi:large subunit ribosomal protein L19